MKDPIILNVPNKKRTEKELQDEIGGQYIFKREYDKNNKQFILIDLKTGKITRKDVSQMQFYINYLNIFY